MKSSKSTENFKGTDEYHQYLKQLLSLSQMLNSSLNVEEVLKMAMDQVVDLLRAERGFIMLFNEKGELELKAYKNVDPQAILQFRDISRTIIGTSTKEGKNVLSVNAQSDPRFKDLESVLMSGMRSVMCVPLKVKARVIGVIYLDNRIEEGMFRETHLEMLSAFGNQSAVAIENARLYENLIRSYDERFRLTQELHQQEKIRLASEEANRLKSEFVSIVSHELRSPLTVIKTYTSALHRDVSLGKNVISEEQKLDIYTTIDREVDRLMNLINKLLDVSRIDAGKPMELNLRDCDLKGLLKIILKLQKTSKFYLDSHIIKDNIPEDLPNIVCDQEKLSQILSNLMENALKYSPGGGDINVTVAYDSEWVVFSIRDKGLGIPKEHLGKLFKKYERFEDEDRKTIPGTGLGLYLIKHLVDLHGGKIWVDTEQGKGSEFKFSLPRRTQQ
ncbi:MAG: ATP-binding protein [Firmicutes bacterium]|nr:ATP-binding protein [Bacillota bacterium]